VIDELLILRAAIRADARILLAWRNHPGTSAGSRQSEPIADAEHEQWLDRVLADPDRDLLIGKVDGRPIGQVRFDGLVDGRREISVGVDPAVQGRGLGRRLIAAGIDWLWRADPGAAAVDAWVRTENHRSLAAFRGCGFALAGDARDGLERLELVRGR